MELAPYVDRLRNDLAEAAAAGGAEAQQAAERLALALDPAVRMTLLEVLSDATAEITGELDDRSVEVRMHGREPRLVVEHLQPHPHVEDEPAPETGIEPDEALGDEDETIARVTVRIPESLKARAEELAASGSQSLNAWIVQAIRFAARERAINIDIDLGTQRFTTPPGTPGWGGHTRTPRHFRGWSR